MVDELVPVDSIVDNHLGESARLQGYVESGGKAAVGSSCMLGMTACCTSTRLILIPFKAKYLEAM